jgi:hypothetical protein
MVRKFAEFDETLEVNAWSLVTTACVLKLRVGLSRKAIDIGNINLHLYISFHSAASPVLQHLMPLY